ncbi:uncharacterized protein ATC70_013497 [Mucor velutinosus]|uniref:RGS domain-containing protein n=1 Tax=Mucor velutinosus TaxID=708070 RepID=A0AAN7D3F0_9FUNG|nr:hypothetical protein ATC70_013497 [Mucor velutinosus]
MSSLQDLPTLEDILSRKTLPPVCLYNFYTVLRDKLYLDNLLDFYLDVRHHEILWRRYVKSVLKSSQQHDLFNSIHRLDGEDPIEKYLDITSSAVPIDKYVDIHHPVIQQSPTLVNNRDSADDISISVPLPIVRPPIGEKLMDVIYQVPDRHDLVTSSERIVHTYLMPGGSKYLKVIPAKIRQQVIESYNINGCVRHDPMLFAEAKHAAFLYMERWAYPPFMRLKVWGNITERQQMHRLVIGLVALAAGFSSALSFIFLNYAPWGTRFWVNITDDASVHDVS